MNPQQNSKYAIHKSILRAGVGDTVFEVNGTLIILSHHMKVYSLNMGVQPTVYQGKLDFQTQV